MTRDDEHTDRGAIESGGVVNSPAPTRPTGNTRAMPRQVPVGPTLRSPLTPQGRRHLDHLQLEPPGSLDQELFWQLHVDSISRVLCRELLKLQQESTVHRHARGI